MARPPRTGQAFIAEFKLQSDVLFDEGALVAVFR
jgi:hypothetical protein